MSPFVKLSSSSDAAVKSKQAAASMEKTTLDTPVKTLQSPFSLWLEGSHCQIECEGGKLSDKTTFFFLSEACRRGGSPPRQEKPTRFPSRQIKYIYLFPSAKLQTAVILCHYHYYSVFPPFYMALIQAHSKKQFVPCSCTLFVAFKLLLDSKEDGASAGESRSCCSSAQETATLWQKRVQILFLQIMCTCLLYHNVCTNDLPF